MPAKPATSESWDLEDADDAASTLSLHLEIEGLGPEQRSLLVGLLGKVIHLPAMRVRVKGADLG
jgi:hypothetical protein